MNVPRRWLQAAAAAAVAAALLCCAARPAPPAAAAERAAPDGAPRTPGIEEGSSLESAVIAPPSNEREGIAWENEWIYVHYGRFRKKSVGLASRGGRRYDVITIELADHTEKVLYFDITDFFGK